MKQTTKGDKMNATQRVNLLVKCERKAAELFPEANPGDIILLGFEFYQLVKNGGKLKDITRS